MDVYWDSHKFSFNLISAPLFILFYSFTLFFFRRRRFAFLINHADLIRRKLRGTVRIPEYNNDKP